MPICRVIGALILLGALSSTLHAQELSQEKDFNIPPQSLAKAVIQFSDQSGIQVVTAGQDVSKLTTEGVKGRLKIGEALKTLLNGTHLGYSVVGSSTVALVNLASSANAVTSGSESPTPPSSEKTALTEIIVTAQKKSERLQDVPVPVTVLSAESLADNGQNQLQDYYATVPGLNLYSVGNGFQTIAIRGLVTGQSNPTVGVSIDDVPYGSSTALGGGGLLYPDIDPSDLARIEVLKGPQGTLYGASSLGGLLKFVTKDPSTDNFDGHVQVLGDSVNNGAVGYGVRGAVNVPITDTVAIRASGFTRRDPGYIDNVLTGQRNVNRTDVDGGRLSALWRPSDTVSFKLSALLQDTKGYGKPSVDINSTSTPSSLTLLGPTTNDLQQTAIPGDGQFTKKARLYTATLAAKLGSLDFISVGAYGTTQYSNPIFDLSLCCAFYASQPAFPDSGVNLATSFETRKVTQEFRLSSPTGRTLEWLAGVFFTHETTSEDQSDFAINSSTYSPLAKTLDFNIRTTLSEYAVFGDVTVHFTDRFDIQLGGRESENRQTYSEVDSSDFPAIFQSTFGPTAISPTIHPLQHADGNAFTYLLTPRFRFSPDLMVYARFSSGYRVGGNNAGLAVNAAQTGVPTQYSPDRTNDYEIGTKGDLFDHVLSFDISAYYINWKNIQILVLNGCCYLNANAGTAKSQGLEMSIETRPVQGLTIGATASLNDAQLTQSLPPNSSIAGASGDRLPYSSRFSGSLSANQEIALASGWTGFVGGTLSYVGARLEDFQYSLTVPRVPLSAYTQLDLHTGLHDRSWKINLFLNNVTNKLGLIGGGANNGSPYAPPYYGIYIQPRTVGLSIDRSF